MNFDPRNILVIDFGQLGDVVLSLPALQAIRARFPKARITVAVGNPGVPIVELSGTADETLGVDRVGLRDGPKPLSILRIAQFARDVCRRKFDFVIDLHSLSETNLLGYLSGAPKRLYARRPGRSLDFLSNFRPQPPIEDQRKHTVERYLDVVAPLNPPIVSNVPRLRTREEDDRAIEQMLKKEKVPMDAPLVGLFPGAGHPGRRWPLERFSELASSLERNDGVRIILFAGPEERALVREMRAAFSSSTIIFDRLTIPQLVSALARLSVFVSNDTGPMHIAAAVSTPLVVMVFGLPAVNAFVPLVDQHRVIYGSTFADISTDQVYTATRSLLTAERMRALFSA